MHAIQGFDPLFSTGLAIASFPNKKPKNPGRKKHRGKDNRKPADSRKPSSETRHEGPQRIVGVLSKSSSGWRLQSTNRRERGEFILHAKTRFNPEEGQLAVAEVLPSQRRGPKQAKLIEILGDMESPRAVSLIAIATHEIPNHFRNEAIAEAEAAKPVTLENRTDLRDIPLVTIDGADARDFDDAVFAEPTADGGWHLLVAIADVAHYVKHGSALDKTAHERGNSVYFPDRVVPMLPEALSNELCSLKPHVERACMAVHMWIDKNGEMTRWEFVRGVMRSHARLTYEQAQAAMDGKPDTITKPLLDKVIQPLYGAYRALMQARGKRGTLELDLPERKVEIDAAGRVKAVNVRMRLDSHRLIEEFMINANVAAAARLEGYGTVAVATASAGAEQSRQTERVGVCLYRVHDKPTELKLDGLRDFLNTLGISLVPAKQIHPRFLTQILENHAGGPHAQVINEVMLRSQAQAIYSPANIGHFGLALAKYAHFTSPIRRYADLIVHRGLIRACKLGKDGLTEGEIEKLQAIADHISMTERRAASAERDAVDRFVTLFMAEHVGATFSARISGVARFGIFARLNETGADGIIPINTLPQDYYFHDEKRQALVGKRSGRVFQLAQPVVARLEQADRLTGGLAFSIVEPAETLEKSQLKSEKANKQRGFRQRGKRR